MSANAVRPPKLTLRVAAEVHELHDRVESLAKGSGRFPPLRFRRDLRDARQAEADLLRVLGFESYAAFVAVHGPRSAPLSPVASVPGPGDGEASDDAREIEARLSRVLGRAKSGDLFIDARGATPDRAGHAQAAAARRGDSSVEELSLRVSALEEELAEARFEIVRLRNEVADRRRDEMLRTVAQRGDVGSLVANIAAVLGELRMHLEGARMDRVEAERRRDDAEAEARRILDQASGDTLAILHNAITTLDRFLRNQMSGAPEDRKD
jgi:hypothetical protein